MADSPQTQQQQDAECMTCPHPFTSECLDCEFAEQAWGTKRSPMRQYYLSFNFIRDRYYPDLLPSSIRLFDAVLSRVGFRPSEWNYGKCWYSLYEFAQETGVSKRQLNRAVKQLESFNLIERTKHRRKVGPNDWKSRTEWSIPYMHVRLQMQEQFDKRAGKKSPPPPPPPPPPQQQKKSASSKEIREDLYPNMTQELIDLYSEHVKAKHGHYYRADDTDLSKFRLASKRLVDFFKEYEKKVPDLRLGVGSNTQSRAKFLWKAIAHDMENSDMELTPGFFCSDTSFKKRLPNYLKHMRYEVRDTPVQERPKKKSAVRVQYDEETEEKRIDELAQLRSSELEHYLREIKDKLQKEEISESDYYNEARIVKQILDYRKYV